MYVILSRKLESCVEREVFVEVVEKVQVLPRSVSVCFWIMCICSFCSLLQCMLCMIAILSRKLESCGC